MFDTSVHLKAHNTTVAWINKQTAPTKLEIYAPYIESKKNKIAGFESRNVKTT